MKRLLQYIINFRKSHRPPQRTLQLVCEDRVLFVWVDLHVSLCGQQHSKCERALRHVYSPHLFKLRCSSNSTNTDQNKTARHIQRAVTQ